MKTQVIQLEYHDDVISTRDKMAWAKSARILLVWPAHAPILNRTVDLIVLQRYSQQLGSQLGLVIQDPEIRECAAEIGLPVFHSIEAANRLPWRRQRRRKKPVQRMTGLQRLQRRSETLEFHEQFRKSHADRNRYSILRIPAFIAGVVAVLALGVFFLPSATVHIQPTGKEQTIKLQVWSDPEIHNPTLTGGIPAHVLQIEVEGEDQMESSGSLIVPDQAAGGNVVFTNLADQDIEVPSGTVLRTLADPPVRFQTLQSVLLPAGPNSTTEVEVRAVNAGTDGNVAADTVVGIEGTIGVQLSVRNPEAMSGGTDRSSRAPSRTDFENLRGRLLANLKKSALEELKGQTQSGQDLIEASLDQIAVLSEERFPEEDQPGDRLRLKMRVQFEAWYYNELDLRAVAVAAMEASLPSGYRSPGMDVTLTALSEPGMQADRARWEVIGQRDLEPASSNETLIRAIAGKTPAEASDTIQEMLDLAQPPQIVLTPARWPRMPYLPFRITVVTP